jgi:hypothetical protein
MQGDRIIETIPIIIFNVVGKISNVTEKEVYRLQLIMYGKYSTAT